MNGVRCTEALPKPTDEALFDFERLEVYQRALEFLDRLFEVHRDFTRDVRYSLGDQLLRAGLAIYAELRAAGRRMTGILHGLLGSLDRTPYTVHRTP